MTWLPVEELPEGLPAELQKYSDWECWLFGANGPNEGITWRPLRDHEPNWFWRKMQFLIVGNRWVYSPLDIRHEPTF